MRCGLTAFTSSFTFCFHFILHLAAFVLSILLAAFVLSVTLSAFVFVYTSRLPSRSRDCRGPRTRLISSGTRRDLQTVAARFQAVAGRFA
jgi:predicted membrane protein